MTMTTNRTAKVTKLSRTNNGWTAKVDGLSVYITDGNAYWFKEAFDGQPLTMAQQNALDGAACAHLYG
jgi:hypothetical protein